MSQSDVFDRVTQHAPSRGGQDPLRDARQRSAGGHDPRLPRLLVFVARTRWPRSSGTFQVVAIDQRGYNLSDKPKGVEHYDMRLLVGDVAAVIKHLGRDRATIVGHDWGGMVAWQFAMNLPQMTENLVILNLPHPNGLLRELESNPEQIKNSEYARTSRPSHRRPTVFFGRPMTAETCRDGCRSGGAQALRRGVRALGLRGDAELLQAQLSRSERRRPRRRRRSSRR